MRRVMREIRVRCDRVECVRVVRARSGRRARVGDVADVETVARVWVGLGLWVFRVLTILFFS